MVLDSCRVWRSDGPRAAELRKRIGQSATADSEEDMGGRKLVITIDGPAGSGKSTVSRRLAEKLSYLYLDTGALYRALAYRAIREGTNQDDEKALAELCLRARVSVQLIDGQARYFAGGEDVSDRIRTEEVGLVASRISAVAEVRKALLPVQREAGKRGGIVAEGRDMGTVVFENADVKFYLDASESERVSRRCKELAERGGAADLDRVKKDLSIRDRQDKERAVAPLKVPEGAFVVDTTALNVDQVLQQMLEDVRRRMEESS